MLAQQFGLLTTTVTNSGFLTGLYVVMVPFLGVLLFREWPHPIVWPCGAGWPLSASGCCPAAMLSALTLGDWLTVLCAAIWALQLVMIARYAAQAGRPVTLAVTQFAVCAVPDLTLGLVLEPFEHRRSVARACRKSSMPVSSPAASPSPCRRWPALHHGGAGRDLSRVGSDFRRAVRRLAARRTAAADRTARLRADLRRDRGSRGLPPLIGRTPNGQALKISAAPPAIMRETRERGSRSTTPSDRTRRIRRRRLE